MLADLMHLCDEDEIDFWLMIRLACKHHYEEVKDWMRVVKLTCIEQAVEANLKPHTKSEIVQGWALSKGAPIVRHLISPYALVDWSGFPKLKE